MKKKSVWRLRRLILFSPFFVFLAFSSCASRGAIQAEEYFAIGMAFFDLGDYGEAEKWLNRARISDRTMAASEYNLGRIAFETGRFEEAALYFERIISKDPENVMALRAAAYSRIRNGDIRRAEEHYARVLALVPENADDGFNHALVLYSIGRYSESEEALKRHPRALEENSASVLLLARAQRAQGKIEALDTYAAWAAMTSVRAAGALHEYARSLEEHEFYAKALEIYAEAVSAHSQNTANLTTADIRFDLARLFLTADPENPEGLRELETALGDGFSDAGAVEALYNDERVTTENRSEIRRILEQIKDSSQMEALPPEA